MKHGCIQNLIFDAWMKKLVFKAIMEKQIKTKIIVG